MYFLPLACALACALECNLRLGETLYYLPTPLSPQQSLNEWLNLQLPFLPLRLSFSGAGWPGVLLALPRSYPHLDKSKMYVLSSFSPQPGAKQSGGINMSPSLPPSFPRPPSQIGQG